MLISLPATKTRPKRTLLGLVDSGTSSSLIDYDQASKNIAEKKREKTTWSTQTGTFNTFAKATIQQLQLPQFTTRRNFNHTFHLFEKKKGDRYDVIIG